MDVQNAKSFHILDETDDDISIGFLTDNGEDKIIIVPKEKIEKFLQQLKDVLEK